MRQDFNARRHGFDSAAKEMTAMVAYMSGITMFTAFRCVLCLFFVWSAGSFALADDVATGRQTAFLYGIDIDFLYLTDVKGFSSDRGSVIATESGDSGAVGGSGSSTFGLRRSSFNLEWRLPRGIGFEAVVRPDAVQRGGVSSQQSVREIDTRSGMVVEEMPEIHFLDEYRLRVKKQSVEARVGVESAILENFMVTPELLGFGLRVRGPEKSFAVGIDAPQLLGFGESKTDDSVGFGLGILSGRDERHDGRRGEVHEVGESPAKRDPYWGGTLNIGVNLSSGTKTSMSVAIIEDHQLSAKTRNEWYGMGLQQKIGRSFLPMMTLGLEARQLKQSFIIEGTTVSDVRLMSAGLTSMVHVSSDDELLLGFWAGSGTIHPEGVLSKSRPTKAFQAEGGWRWVVEEQLEFTAMVSREWRWDENEQGSTVGGFINGDTKRSAQSRFAIQMRYHVGGQI